METAKLLEILRMAINAYKARERFCVSFTTHLQNSPRKRSHNSQPGARGPTSGDVQGR